MKNVCRTPYYNENFTYLSLRDEYDLLQNCFHFYKDMLYAPRKTMRDIYKIISFWILENLYVIIGLLLIGINLAS